MIYEKIAASRICVLNNRTIKEVCTNNKYDFKTDDNIKYEVKCDKSSNKTGNFYIELLTYNNKPSGISTTKSDYYIITNTINYYMISTSILKLLCKNMRVLTLKDKSSTGFIVPCHIVISNSIII